MDFLRQIEWTPLNIAKAVGLALVGLIVLAIAFNILGAVAKPIMQSAGVRTVSVDALMPRSAMSAVMRDDAFEMEEYGYGASSEQTALSVRNVASSLPPSMPAPMPRPGGGAGGDAEEFEVTDYNASIETRDKERTCAAVADLKRHGYVVFENANEYDRGCSYTFKVEQAHVSEILSVIESLDPKELSENTYTIKRQVDDFTSEEEILEKKLASIDETLDGAIEAYEDVTALATRTQNADSLAKIIDSRISIIERLTERRIDTVARLERLSRAKAEQLDKLVYTYFHVNVYENKFIDGERIADSWKAAVKRFANDVNGTLQDLTVGLIALFLMVVQYVIYLLILIFVAKYLWRAAKYIWTR